MKHWLAVLACVGLWASTVQAAERALDLRAYLALVEAHNPELNAAQKQRGQALAEERIARAYPNPDIEIGAGSWQPRAGGRSGDVSTLGISQRIELPSVREARIGAARSGIAVTDALIETVRQQVGYAAIQAWYDALRRGAEFALANENAALLGAMRDRVRARVDVGEAPRFELTRIETEVLVARNLAESARLRLEEARAVMRRLSGNRLPTAFLLDPAEPPRSTLQPLPVLQALVLENHPSLRVLVAENARARARLEQELALRNPQPTLQLLQSRDPDTR